MQVRFQVAKYDTDGDERISFPEFSRFATDLVSSSVQYQRAVNAARVRLGNYDSAAETAEKANQQTVAAQAAQAAEAASFGGDQEWAVAQLADIEQRITSSTFTEALSVLRTQDELFRRFKVSRASA